MAIRRLAAGSIDIVEEREALDQRMLVGKGGGENRQRRIAVAPRHVSQHLVVGAVLFDDQKDVLDE